MTIERIKGLTTVTCDGAKCHEFIEASGFQEILDSLRMNNWRTDKVGSDWFHFCPNCQKKPDLTKLMSE